MQLKLQQLKLQQLIFRSARAIRKVALTRFPAFLRLCNNYILTESNSLGGPNINARTLFHSAYILEIAVLKKLFTFIS